MSLLNDALRRAQKAQEQPVGTGFSSPPLQPVCKPRPGLQSKIWTASLIISLILPLGIWFIATSSRGARVPQPGTFPLGPSLSARLRPNPTHQAITPSVRPVGPVATSLPLQSERAPAPSFSQAPASPPRFPAGVTPAKPPPQPVTSATSSLAALEPASTEPTKLDLQAIYYRFRRPTARINNRTVSVGQEVDGARVLSIERHSVALLVRGKTALLQR